VFVIQDIVPNCPHCGETPNNWHIKTEHRSASPNIWIFPEKRLKKELLDKASRIRAPVMMSPVPHTKEDLVCALDKIYVLVCTSCHRQQQGDKILMIKIKNLILREYAEAGDRAFLKLGI